MGGWGVYNLYEYGKGGKVHVARLLMLTSQYSRLDGVFYLWYIGSLMKHQFMSSNFNLVIKPA